MENSIAITHGEMLNSKYFQGMVEKKKASIIDKLFLKYWELGITLIVILLLASMVYDVFTNHPANKIPLPAVLLVAAAGLVTIVQLIFAIRWSMIKEGIQLAAGSLGLSFPRVLDSTPGELRSELDIYLISLAYATPGCLASIQTFMGHYLDVLNNKSRNPQQGLLLKDLQGLRDKHKELLSVEFNKLNAYGLLGKSMTIDLYRQQARDRAQSELESAAVARPYEYRE